MLTALLVKGFSLSDRLEQQCACVFKHFDIVGMIIIVSIIVMAMEIAAVMMIMD